MTDNRTVEVAAISNDLPKSQREDETKTGPQRVWRAADNEDRTRGQGKKRRLRNRIKMATE